MAVAETGHDTVKYTYVLARETMDDG